MALFAGGVPCVRAGVPTLVMDVHAPDNTCPRQAPCFEGGSWVSGFKGSVQIDLPVGSVEGVPGLPVDIVLHYSSASDDAGTYQGRLAVDVRHEFRTDLAYRPATVEELGIELSDAQGAFAADPAVDPRGLWFNGVAGDGWQVCNPYRDNTSLDHPTTPNRSERMPAYLTRLDRCGTRVNHDDTTEYQVRTFGIPVVMNGSGLSSVRIAEAQDCADAPVRFLTFADRGVYRVRVGLQTLSVAGARNRHGMWLGTEPCQAGQPAYLEKFADPSVARMGVNWSHSFAQHLSFYDGATRADASYFVVLHDPQGGARLFVEPIPRPAPPFELTPVPDTPVEGGSGCTCHRTRLFRTTRGYELLHRDGSRRVFAPDVATSSPPGRLLRIEGLYGRNAIELSYDTVQGELASIRDAAGNEYDFTYVGSGADRRLERIDLPGGRFATLGYDVTYRRLIEFRDPGLSVRPDLDAMRFEYGTSADAKDRYDIVTKREPDGEVVTYEYFPFTPGIEASAGKVYRITRGSRVLTYNLTTGRFDGSILASFTPGNPASAPSIMQFYHADGRLQSRVVTCSQDCPTVSGLPIYQLVERLQYDGTNKLISRDLGSHLESVSARTCYRFDADHNLKAVRGPLAWVPATGSLWDDWGESDCDQHVEGNPAASAQVCPADVTKWESVPLPTVPTDLGPGLTYFRPTSITPASEPEEGGKTLRFFYYPSSTTGSLGNEDELQYVCHPEYTGAPDAVDSECVKLEYEKRTGPNSDIVLLSRVEDGNRKPWTFTYHDAAAVQGKHLLATMTEPPPVSYATSFTYLATGLVDTVTAPGDAVTRYEWTPRGQLEYVTSPKDAGSTRTTAFAYTPAGKLRRITDVKREVAWWFLYDAEGRQVRVTRGPSTHATGEVLPASVVDPREVASPARTYIQREYDANDNVVQTLQFGDWVSPPTCPPTSGLLSQYVYLRYDGFGNLRERDTNPPTGVEECFTVDPRIGQIVEARFGLPWRSGEGNQAGCDPLVAPEAIELFRYNAVGAVKEAAFTWQRADGSVGGRHGACYGRDAYGRLAEMHADATPTADPTPCPIPSPLAQDIYYQYDAAQRLTDLIVDHAGLPSARYKYTYDGAQQLTNRHDAVMGGDVTYTYRANGQVDVIQQAAEEMAPGGFPTTRVRLFELTYDSRGTLGNVVNRDPVTPPGASAWYRDEYTYVHDDIWRLTSARLDRLTFPPAGSPTIYDITYGFSPTDDWNIASVTNAVTGETRTQTYNVHDEVVTVNGAPSGFHYDLRGNLRCDGTRNMLWDGLNRMKQVTFAGETTEYAYDPFNRLVAQRTDAGPVLTRMWDGWMQLGEYAEATADPDIVFASDGTGVLGHHRPGQGFDVYGQNHQGSRIDGIDDNPAYEPYGTLAIGALSSSIGFQGHEFHPEAGLYYMRNRWYDPANGTFASVDPAISDIVNAYQLADRSPAIYWDPLGLTRMDLHLSEGWLRVDPEQSGKPKFLVPFTSGAGTCMNNPSTECCEAPFRGPIPPGRWFMLAEELSDPPGFWDRYRNRHHGDWGDWRVRIHPQPGNDTKRENLFLHTGAIPGTQGCVDVGGGVSGSELTDRIRDAIKEDPDGRIPFNVFR
jgi:RHS repeat-associated protein